MHYQQLVILWKYKGLCGCLFIAHFQHRETREAD